MKKGNFIISGMGLKCGHSKSMHINKELPMGQHCSEHAVSGKLAYLDASINCLHTDACCMENKQEE